MVSQEIVLEALLLLPFLEGDLGDQLGHAVDSFAVVCVCELFNLSFVAQIKFVIQFGCILLCILFLEVAISILVVVVCFYLALELTFRVLLDLFGLLLRIGLLTGFIIWIWLWFD